MHEVEAKVKKLSELKEQLVTAATAECAKGLQSVKTEELAAVTDMIKDLSEAEEKCWKACYYKTVLEQMKKAEESGASQMPDMPLSWMLPNDRMGYDHYRYSSGRFAPKGHGTYSPGRSGYPTVYYDDSMNDRMGYNGGGSSGGNSSGGQSGGSGGSRGGSSSSGGSYGYTEPYSDARSEYGRSYDRFRSSRRHYTETHSTQDREAMKVHGKEHVMEAVTAMKEIWSEADPELRKQMKESITALMSDMQ